MVSLNELRAKEVKEKEDEEEEDDGFENDEEDDFTQEILDAIAEAERLEEELLAQDSFYKTSDYVRLPCVSHKVSVSLPGILEYLVKEYL